MGGSVSSTSGTPTILDLRIYERPLLAESGSSHRRKLSQLKVRYASEADIEISVADDL